MSDLDNFLAGSLVSWQAQGLSRHVRPAEMLARGRIRMADGELLSFASNDYLGLGRHPALEEAACLGIRQEGAGSGAAHLLGGHRPSHHQLERALASFVGREAALLFANGYMANLGVLSALAGRGDTVFADRLNHASLNDAVLLSRARLLRYRHGDLSHLESLLQKAPQRGHRFIVSDGVFSMDGDLAPLPELAQLAGKYDAWMIIDDAHGLGVVGPQGRGSVRAAGLDGSTVPVLVGTLGKAFGVYGAFVAGSRTLVDYLIQRARTYVYTTALPPCVPAALLTAVRIVEEEDWRRERLAAHVRCLHARLGDLPWRLLPSATPIQPLLVGDSRVALALSAALRERGLFIPPVRPPTVPQGGARLRITLSAAHEEADVDTLIAALRDLASTGHAGI